MLNLFWRLLAKFLAQPAIANRLIYRAIRTPYDHLIVQYDRVYRVSRGYKLNILTNGESYYMKRFWLLRLGYLQIRVHNILSEDPGRDHHSHPWPFRTIILSGTYTENRLKPDYSDYEITRTSGDTGIMRMNEWHRISSISGDVWTLFITFGRQREWGFLVDGKYVPHDEYGESIGS